VRAHRRDSRGNPPGTIRVLAGKIRGGTPSADPRGADEGERDRWSDPEASGAHVVAASGKAWLPEPPPIRSAPINVTDNAQVP